MYLGTNYYIVTLIGNIVCHVREIVYHKISIAVFYQFYFNGFDAVMS